MKSTLLVSGWVGGDWVGRLVGWVVIEWASGCAGVVAIFSGVCGYV